MGIRNIKREKWVIEQLSMGSPLLYTKEIPRRRRGEKKLIKRSSQQYGQEQGEILPLLAGLSMIVFRGIFFSS